MKRAFKKNQAVLTLLAVMIAVAGYLNYISKSTEDGVNSVSATEEVAVNQMLEENQQAGGVVAESQPGDAVFTSSDIVEFISQVNLNKEQVRAENKEMLLSIINNEQLSETAKQDAVNQMVQMTTVAEKENETEMLLAAKGFENAVVSITDESVDVVVGRTELSDAERAQIEDIVKRKTEFSVDSIVISLMAGSSVTDEGTGDSSEIEETEAVAEESVVAESTVPEE